MNYLELVQAAMKMAKVRTAVPDTLTDVVDVALDFKEYVADSWRELQEESLNWGFRQKLDQTLSLSQGVDEYAMPTDLETINFRTVTCYTIPKQDESELRRMEYEDWRMLKDTVETREGLPQYLIERPDGVLQVWPVPSLDDYTLRYDGVWDIDEMLIDTDTPGSNISGGTLLDERYHWVIVYDAARRYYEDHENPEGVEKMQNKFKAHRSRISERQAPKVYVKPGQLTGWRNERRYY